MKRLRIEDPRDGNVTLGPPFGDMKQANSKVYGEAPCSLEEALLRYWTYGFLWGMSLGDRVAMLELSGALGRPANAWEIAGTIGKLGLKGWEDFPQSYKEAPIKIVEE